MASRLSAPNRRRKARRRTMRGRAPPGRRPAPRESSPAPGAPASRCPPATKHSPSASWKVEAGQAPSASWPGPAARVAMVELAGRVGLVRRLVGREPDVPVNPEHRPPRIAHQLGSHAREPDIHLLHQGPERVPHLRLVLGAVPLEPLAAVVPREAAQEASAAGRKPRNSVGEPITVAPSRTGSCA